MVMPGDERENSTERNKTERKKTLRNHETNTMSNLAPVSCLLFHAATTPFPRL